MDTNFLNFKIKYDKYISQIKNEDIVDYLDSLCAYEETYSLNHMFTNFLIEQDYIPNQVQDARIFLQKYLVLKDENEPIITTFNGKPLQIIENNFYNAYNTSIWKKLSLMERARVVNWHFKANCKRSTWNKVNFTFIPSEFMSMIDCNGYYYLDEKHNEVYVNFSSLTKDSGAYAMVYLEHELTHMRQSLYVRDRISNELDAKLPKKYINTLYKHVCYNRETLDNYMSYEEKGSIFTTKRFSFYLASLHEVKARTRSIKQARKIALLNDKQLGKDVELKRNIVQADKEHYAQFLEKCSEDEKKLYLKYIKNAEYLTKILLIRDKLRKENEQLQKQIKEHFYEIYGTRTFDLPSKYECNEQIIKKLDKVVENFLKTGNKQKLDSEIKNQSIEIFGE